MLNVRSKMTPMLRTESDGDIMSNPNDSAGNVG